MSDAAVFATMLDRYQTLCLNAFPDHDAFLNAIRTLGLKPFGPEPLKDAQGSLWTENIGSAPYADHQLMIGLAHSHAVMSCGVATRIRPDRVNPGLSRALVLHFLANRPDGRSVDTRSTETQLKGKPPGAQILWQFRWYKGALPLEQFTLVTTPLPQGMSHYQLSRVILATQEPKLPRR